VEELTGALAARLVETGVFQNLSVGTVGLFLTMGALLLVSFLIGVVAVLAGVGGGVLFVPLVSALFAIHVDFIRGAGLMVALVGSVAAAPRLMRRRFSRLRVSIPLALCGSAGSIVGARLGLLVPADTIILILGVFMIVVAVQTAVQAYRATRPDARTRGSTERNVRTGLSERIADRWSLSGSYHDPAIGGETVWRAHRIVPAMGLFLGIGVLGGLLGVGAGWANVPVLTGFMGLPVKLAAATSGLIIVANSSAAVWVYLAEGAVRPLVVAPALAGMIVGTRLGARMLGAARPQVVRITVIAILLLAGIRTITGAL
jgi:uncharacterized membrane protein YfcA